MMKIEDIEFALSHFQDQIQLFPRKMMTFTSPWQFSVSSVEEVFERCKQSSLVDCRINAYPEYTEYKGIIRQPPNFIFIDLDLGNFEMDRKKLDSRLKKTLKKIEEYNGLPAVLWTGNGYHIYLPIGSIVLDQESIFSGDRFPNLFSDTGKYSNWSVSEVFLKYAEIFFTNGKADPQHKPKYKTCLIRIPGSYNSKLLNKGLCKEESLVKIVQKWDGKSLPIQKLLRSFRAWITKEEYEQILAKRKVKRTGVAPKQIAGNNIDWIEKLLQTGIADGRKETLRLILAPYLIKRKSYDESVNILEKWLDKCNYLRPLDRGFNSKQRIKASLNNTKGFLILDNLKMKYPFLHSIISKSIKA